MGLFDLEDAGDELADEEEDEDEEDDDDEEEEEELKIKNTFH